jgi:dihydroneopterin aldolase
MKEAFLTKLTVKGAEFFAYHGVKPEENVLGGKYQVDLELFYNSTKAVINDDVAYALDYDDAMFCVEEVIGGQYRLIETIANEILNMLFDKYTILEKATVRVRKYNAPIRTCVSYIETEQTIQRNL